MKTSTILTISGLALIFTSVLTWLSARYDVSFEEAPRGTHKKLGPKGRKMTFTITNMLFFVGFVLIGVSQLLGENKDGYKNMPPVSDCRDMKQMKTLTNSGEQTTVAPPLKCNSSGITGNCTQIPSSAAIVDQCGKCVKGTNCPTLDVNSKDYSCFTAPGGYKGGITCGDGIDTVNFTTAN